MRCSRWREGGQNKQNEITRQNIGKKTKGTKRENIAQTYRRVECRRRCRYGSATTSAPPVVNSPGRRRAGDGLPRPARLIVERQQPLPRARRIAFCFFLFLVTFVRQRAHKIKQTS